MREIRLYGSEGGGTELNRSSLPLSTPRLRVLGKGQNWLVVAHQLASAYKISSSLR